MKPALAVVIVLVLVGLAAARDRGQYAQASPEMRDWFKNLKNPRGVPCCEDADGHHVADADWRRNDDGTYSVRLDGEWRSIPPDAVLDVPNRAGTAMVWIWRGTIMCFLRGAEG